MALIIADIGNILFYQVIKYILQISSKKKNRVKLKQKKHTIKLVNTRHSAHLSQASIPGTLKIMKIEG